MYSTFRNVKKIYHHRRREDIFFIKTTFITPSNSLSYKDTESNDKNGKGGDWSINELN